MDDVLKSASLAWAWGRAGCARGVCPAWEVVRHKPSSDMSGTRSHDVAMLDHGSANTDTGPSC